MPIELQTVGAPSAGRAAPAAGAAEGAKAGLERWLPQGGAFSSQDRMFLTERLALLLDTGNALHASLEALRRQSASPALRGVVESLERDVSGGLSFSEALRRQPEAFPETYVALVAAAEKGGFLPEVLNRLLEMEEKSRELRGTLVGALTYPAFLVVFSVAVVVFVLVVVFPKFGELFEMIRDELPITTVFLLAASDLLRHYGPVLLGAMVGGGLLAWRWARSAAGVEALDALAYRTPLVREFVSELALVQFLQVVSLSLANGVPLVDALRACRSAVGSPRFRRFVDALGQGVQEGRGIAVGFREATFLPPLVGQMIATGEETGSLARVMERVAGFYEREWRKRLQAATKLVEPVMLLVMGVAVGIIVSSLLLPIFKLSRAVH